MYIPLDESEAIVGHHGFCRQGCHAPEDRSRISVGLEAPRARGRSTQSAHRDRIHLWAILEVQRPTFQQITHTNDVSAAWSAFHWKQVSLDK